MPTILLKFPGGHYHATPWGHHVNEGLIEWPPCPWRLLRALIAVGYSSQGWTEIPPVGRRLIESLAGVLPTYQLPHASAAHSRHYMPIGELAKGVERTTLVFDTWANVGGELGIRWDCELDAAAIELFKRLVETLGYLGRSESWVEARVVSEDWAFDADQMAVPHRDGEYRGPEWEQISLMTPVPPRVYADWHAAKSKEALAEFPLPEGKRKPTKSLLKKREAAVAPYPEDLLDCLQKDTAWWKKQHHWSQPPGSQRVLYWRRVDSLVVSRPRAPRHSSGRAVEAMLLALTTPSRNKSALPHIHRTLPQGELFHQVIVARLGKGQRVDCPELIGRNQDDKPLRDGHRHAHLLHLDLDGDNHLDHVLVYAPMGLGHRAQQAIRSLKKTYTKGGVGELQVALVGRGSLEGLRQLPGRLKSGIESLLGPEQRSTTWNSLTPFVPPRYIKRQGRNSLEGQIHAELESRGLPKANDVQVLKEDSIAFRHFVRVRRHGGPPPPRDTGYAIRIQFAEPVPGPLTLGYACHFGLGLFAAEFDSQSVKQPPKESED